MKLLVIGHSVEDHIHYKDRDVQKDSFGEIKPGGIFYSAASLVNYKNEEDEIYLCTQLEKSKEGLFSSVYDKLNKEYIQYVDTIPKVHLMIKDEGEREECYGSINKNLTLSLNEIEKFDGILINMITGFDLSLEQLVSIRQNYNGPVYLDVHTFSRGLANDMKRDFRVIPDFNKWAENVDIIQVNKYELKTLSLKQKDEDIIEEVLNFSVRYLIVTLEKEGAKLYTSEKNNLLVSHEPAIKVNVKNKIGCGDVFGSVFFYNYIKLKDVNKALKLANIAAGCAASFSELSEYKSLRSDVLSRYN